MLLPTSHMPEPLYLLITVNSTWKTHVHFKSSASTTDLGISLSKPTFQGSSSGHGTHTGQRLMPETQESSLVLFSPRALGQSITKSCRFQFLKLSQNCLLFPTFHQCPRSTDDDLLPELGPLHGSPAVTPAPLQWFVFDYHSYCLGDKFDHLMSMLKLNYQDRFHL